MASFGVNPVSPEASKSWLLRKTCPSWAGSKSTSHNHCDEVLVPFRCKARLCGVLTDTTSVFEVAGAAEPGDRVGNALLIGARAVAKFAPGLCVFKKHALARHPQPFASHERLALAQVPPQFSRNRDRIDSCDGKPQPRRPAPDHARDLHQHGVQMHILASENVALADRALAERREMPRRHIVDMHEIKARIDKAGHAPARRLDNDASR